MSFISQIVGAPDCSVKRERPGTADDLNALEQAAREGESPVYKLSGCLVCAFCDALSPSRIA